MENISGYQAQDKIIDYFKSLLGKTVTKTQISKFRKIIASLDNNFKGSQSVQLSQEFYLQMQDKERALMVVKSGFISLNNTYSYYKISSIVGFESYVDGTFAAYFIDKKISITARDYNVLKYVLE